MAIEFKRIRSVTRLLNPFKGFTADEIPFEIRFDPLTGQTGHIFDLPYTPPKVPDIGEIVKRSREIPCPFCPDVVETSTPLFPESLIPEGRLRVGEAVLVPNLLPLDRYTGVCVMSPKHHMGMEEFTPETMRDAFTAAVQFAGRVAEADTGVRFFNINWNYMPQAGSSMVHPHIQVNCGDVPTNQLRVQMDASRAYLDENGANFWEDYLTTERKAKERYVGAFGAVHWVLNFVPLSIMPDLCCIFPAQDSLLGFRDQDIHDFLEGLTRALKYIQGEGFSSFNMSLFSTRQDPAFRVNARVCPRTLIREIGNSDYTYYQALHREPCTHRTPA